MSRIEKALEKAAKMRQEKNENSNTNLIPALKVSTIERERVTFRPSPYLVTLTDPTSSVTEEYRKLKARIVKITKSRGFLNTIMVTSSIGTEGKTVTAMNLAITLAQEYDHTVLLIDADLRQPDIHRHLNTENQKGLTDYLLNKAELSDILLKTELERLDVLPAGSRVDNPVELIMSDRMKGLLNELKHQYANRYIIVDTPPLLPFAESHHLASIVDGVILVVREEHVPLSNLKEALQILKDTNILGVVYNNATLERFNDNYYYYYERYRYRQGDGDKE